MEKYFASAEAPEVCARVLYAWAKRLYTLSGDSLTDVNHVILELPRFSRTSDPDDQMSTAIGSLATYAAEGMRIKVWANHVVMRSRAGYGLRHCYFFVYKGNRRDPRVTNRGVRTTSVGDTWTTTDGATVVVLGVTYEGDTDNSRGGLDNDDTTEGGTLPPEVVKRRVRVARAGR